jgi:hypothetical protein
MVFQQGGDLYVVGRFNNRVVRYNRDGILDRTFISSHLSQPFGLRFLPITKLPEDSLLVASGNDNAIESFGTFTGIHQNRFATGLSFPIGVEIGPNETVYVANFGDDSVVRFNGRTGEKIDTFIPSGTGGLNGPNFMTFRPPTPPSLKISRSGDNVVISWPVQNSDDFRLYQSLTVDFANQADASASYSLNDESIIATMSIRVEGAFFRLQKP